MDKIKLKEVKKIIIVASGKGGVGKSTVAAGIALKLAGEGYRTGLMDGDIYGPSVPTMFGTIGTHPTYTKMGDQSQIIPFNKFGVQFMSIGCMVEPDKAIIWRGPLASNGLKQILTDTAWDNLDYLIVDTPPGTGDIHLTLLQQFYINGVIVVTTPQAVSMADVQKAVAFFKDPHFGIPVMGIVENMAWFSPSRHPEEQYHIFGKNGGQHLANQFDLQLIAQIPIDEHLCETCDTGQLNKLFNNPTINHAFNQIISSIIKPPLHYKGDAAFTKQTASYLNK
jgi:ATP-binding protein involved in chromosome partitioning